MLDEKKVRKVIMRNLEIKETPTDGIWAHKSELRMGDIERIFKELNLNTLNPKTVRDK